MNLYREEIAAEPQPVLAILGDVEWDPNIPKR
jgi:hypothetical protein